MGRRSISSTKAGKFMNPTDQASKEKRTLNLQNNLLNLIIYQNKIGKEARRKELKKNKKQRLQVRQAVIKQKDPKHLLNDMELLDKMGK
jgi:WW domain-binding protein 11